MSWLFAVAHTKCSSCQTSLSACSAQTPPSPSGPIRPAQGSMANTTTSSSIHPGCGDTRKHCCRLRVMKNDHSAGWPDYPRSEKPTKHFRNPLRRVVVFTKAYYSHDSDLRAHEDWQVGAVDTQRHSSARAKVIRNLYKLRNPKVPATDHICLGR